MWCLVLLLSLQFGLQQRLIELINLRFPEQRVICFNHQIFNALKKEMKQKMRSKTKTHLISHISSLLTGVKLLTIHKVGMITQSFTKVWVSLQKCKCMWKKLTKIQNYSIQTKRKFLFHKVKVNRLLRSNHSCKTQLVLKNKMK